MPTTTTDLNTLTTAQLVAVYNATPGTKPVKKFEDRATAIRRVQAAQAAAPQPVEVTAPAPWRPAPGTKKAVILDMIRRPGGATEAEICSAIGWKACAVTLRRVCRKAGFTPVLIKVEGEPRGRYVAQ